MNNSSFKEDYLARGFWSRFFRGTLGKCRGRDLGWGTLEKL